MQSLSTSIRKRGLSPKRKRAVAVAKDVLKWLCSPEPDLLVTLDTGTYLRRLQTPTGVEPTSNAQDHIDLLTPGCQVCALGACLLSYVRLYNNVTISELLSVNTAEEARNFISEQLSQAFSLKQLTLIECAFELAHQPCDRAGAKVVWPSHRNTDRAVKFGLKYLTPRPRLKAIMMNVIKNKGVFKP